MSEDRDRSPPVEGSSPWLSLDPGLFPFQVTESSRYTIPDVAAEAVLPKDQCGRLLTRMFALWGVTDNSIKTLLLNAVLIYFVTNGSSRRARYHTPLKVYGVEYPSAVIRRVLGNDVRRFARAYADYTRDLMKKNPDFAAQRANAMGMDADYDEFAFDFADYCSDLNPDQRKAIARAKRAVLSTTAAIPDVDIDVASNVQSVPETASPAAAVPPVASRYRRSD